MRKTLALFLALALPGLAMASEKCYIISFLESQPTQPPEKLCIGNPVGETRETQVRLMWGSKQVAVFNFIELQNTEDKQVFRTYAPSGYFTPALNAFSFNMVGTIDPATRTEKGFIQIGNQISGKQKLYYVSE